MTKLAENKLNVLRTLVEASEPGFYKTQGILLLETLSNTNCLTRGELLDIEFVSKKLTNLTERRLRGPTAIRSARRSKSK